MTEVMQGVRILEVAEHTFVPAASALLADWGAEVVKIEHVERGDAMRGLASTGVVADMGNDVHPLLEHSNRGKKSLGLDLTAPCRFHLDDLRAPVRQDRGRRRHERVLGDLKDAETIQYRRHCVPPATRPAGESSRCTYLDS